jgi:hypothetical protein
MSKPVSSRSLLDVLRFVHGLNAWRRIFMMTRVRLHFVEPDAVSIHIELVVYAFALIEQLLPAPELIDVRLAR